MLHQGRQSESLVDKNILNYNNDEMIFKFMASVIFYQMKNAGIYINYAQLGSIVRELAHYKNPNNIEF